MTMIQRRFYLPEDLYTHLEIFAKSRNKTVNALLREFLQEGLKRKLSYYGGKSTRRMLEVANLAKKGHWKGPADLSLNHDKYFVEAYNKQYKRRQK